MITLREISSKRGLECSKMAGEYALHQSLGEVDMCGGFDTFKVKVPVIYFGTGGFSPRRDGR